MRISRRTSGGRGEYEVSEPSPQGITPSDLVGYGLALELGPSWPIDTGTYLTKQGGKRRIRLSAAEIHPHLQLAAAVLMPHPVRADEAFGRGAPILRSDRYAIDHIELGNVRLEANMAYLEVKEVIVRNATYQAHSIDFFKRLHDLMRLWDKATKLPERIWSLVEQHRAVVTTGNTIPRRAGELVGELQNIVTETGSDLGIVRRSETEDVLPDLLRTLEWAEEPPEPPLSLAEVEPEEVEIRRRIVKDWKRWVASRGAASARFRQRVREAYNSTCVVCGLHLPATSVTTSAGVDAAHILPWAEYDLDDVQNGLCLCKHHHWAFDEGLLIISWTGSHYMVEIPEAIAKGVSNDDPLFSLNELKQHAGPIPPSRLPRERGCWPHPSFLRQLNESGY